MSVEFYTIAFVMVFFVGVSKSGFAAGVGALAVPILSLQVSPAFAAGIMLPILLLVDLSNLQKYRRVINWRLVKMLIPGATLGIVLGSLSFAQLDADVLRLFVGAIAVWFASLYFGSRIIPKLGVKMGLLGALLLSALSGYSSTLAHAGAPPMRAFLLSQNLEKSAYVGTNGFVFLIINSLKVPAYLAVGQINWESLTISGWLLPAIVLGIIVGRYLHDKISQGLFVLLANLFLMLAGLRLLYDGLVALI